MEKKRLFAFDAIKLFAIFLVLWGHSIQYLQSSPASENALYRTIYSFHMPLFMMIAGYFSVSSMSMSLVDLMKKKGMQLIIPAVVWSILVSFTDSLYGGENSFRFHIKDDYWFLKSLFVCYTLTWLGSHLKIKESIWIFLVILVTQLFEIWKLPIMFPCFIIGLSLRKYCGFKNLISRGGGIIMLGLLFTLGLLFWNSTFWERSFGLRKMIVAIFYGNSSFEWQWLFRRYYPYFIGIIGSLFFIGIFNRVLANLNHCNNMVSLCSDWGQKTMGVYLIQLLLLETILPHYYNFDGINPIVYDLVITPLVSLIALVLCVYIVKLLEKAKITSVFLLGKKSTQ